jgi:hypothetical protein
MTVSAPQRDGPDHFIDFLADGGCDGGVADIRVDFDEEIAADDHRFEIPCG